MSKPPHNANGEANVFPGLMFVACWVFAISIILEVLSSRCLYADGAFNFITDVCRPKFSGFGSVRSIADDIFQFPMQMAIQLGVRNLFWLRLAFGLGRLLPWPIALLICHRLAPRHFWLAALACGAGYLNAAFVAVGEHAVAHAFFWPAVFALVFVRPLTPFAAAMLLLSAVVLLESYESLLFLGPVLAGLAVWRGFSSAEKTWARLVYFVAAFLFMAAAAIALSAVLKPGNHRELGGFKTDTFAMLFRPGWTMKWTALWIFLMIGVCVSERFQRITAHRVTMVILILGICIWGAWPLLKPDDLRPAEQFNARFLDLLVPLALLPVALAIVFFHNWFQLRRQRLIAFTAALLLAQSLWQISATWQWQGFVGILRGVLASRAGYLPISGTPLADGSIPGQSLRFIGGVFDWDNPCLCIALSPGGHVRMMFHSAPEGYAPRWQPFDPLNPKTFPDLKRYGVDYSDYISALNNSSQK